MQTAAMRLGEEYVPIIGPLDPNAEADAGHKRSWSHGHCHCVVASETDPGNRIMIFFNSRVYSI